MRVMVIRKEFVHNSSKKKVKPLWNRFKPISEQLVSVLRIVNLLPLNSSLEPINVDEINWEDWASESHAQLKASIEGLPKDFRDYIALPDKARAFNEIVKKNNMKRFELYLKEYSEIQSAVLRFNSFIQYQKNIREIIRLSEVFIRTKTPFHTSISSFTSLSIDAEGHLKVALSFFMEAIDGVDIKRIRQCPVCEKVFWAGRITQKCCSPRCSNTFRARRFRFKTNEEKHQDKCKRISKQERKD